MSSFGSGSSELTYFDFMKPDSPFGDVRVRKALAHAVNRQEIIDTLYRGLAILQNSLFVKFPATTGYDEELANNEPFPYDVQTAKQLLDAAGYADGFETQITTYDTSTTPGTPQMMEAVSNYLAEVGVISPVRFMEAGLYVGKFRKKELTGMGRSHMVVCKRTSPRRTRVTTWGTPARRKRDRSPTTTGKKETTCGGRFRGRSTSPSAKRCRRSCCGS